MGKKVVEKKDVDDDANILQGVGVINDTTQPNPTNTDMEPTTEAHAIALLAVLDDAATRLVNPDDVGHALAIVLAKRDRALPDRRSLAASYVTLLASMTDALACSVSILPTESPAANAAARKATAALRKACIAASDAETSARHANL